MATRSELIKRHINMKPPTPKEDIIIAKGVGLYKSEWEEIETAATELGMTPHKLHAHAVRYFMRRYRSGIIKLKTKTITVLPSA